MSKKALLVVAVVVLSLGVEPAAAFDWWNSSWHYRVNITINTSSYNRTDWPVEYKINFTSLGAGGTFDDNSTRIIEYWENGTIKDAGVGGNGIISQFDKASNYSVTNNAFGELTWLLSGNRSANTNYYYVVYFDKTANGNKPATNYSTQLTFYNNSGSEFWVNNSKLAVRVDSGTSRYYYASGMYYVEFRDTGLLLFNASNPAELPIEYTVYYNNPNYYTYDFRNNFEVVVDGPIKKVVELQGNEIYWGNDTPTGKGSMIKRYTFYENNKWIKIEQNFTSNQIGLQRESNGQITALAFDLNRTEMRIDFTKPFAFWNGSGNNTDPYSWKSVVNTTVSPSRGLGIINLNETLPPAYNPYTQGYGARHDTVLKRIGIDLTSVTVDAGKSISETAAVIFNDESIPANPHAPVTDLRDRLAQEIVPVQGALESWGLEVQALTDYDFYNRGETVNITGNITTDTHEQNSTANATLTAPNGVNTSFNLDKNGSLYVSNYTFSNTSLVGRWRLTIRVYDIIGQLLNTSVKYFNLTNVYNMSIRFKNDDYYGLVNETVFDVNVTVKNYLNQTGINGTLYCEYNSTPVTVVENITYLGEGIYSLNFSSPQIEGIYNLTCNLTKDGNLGTRWVLFETYIAKNTTLETLVTSANTTIVGITRAQNQSFDIIVNVTNVGKGMAYTPNITLYLPANLTANVTFLIIPINITPNGGGYIGNFKITVLNATPPGNYTITATTRWKNYEEPGNSSTGGWNITVSPNPVLNITQESISQNAGEGNTTTVGNFTIYSAGNYKLRNISIYCDNASGEACRNFTVNFSSSFISEILEGNSLDISVNVSVPEGYSPGTYSGNIYAVDTVSNKWDVVTLNVTVPDSKTWVRTPNNCSKVAPPNKSGDICEVTINNTGNVLLNFSAASYENGSNYTFVANMTNFSITNFSVPKSSSYKIKIRYNTSNAVNATYLTNFTLNATNGGASPPQNVTVTLRVELGPSIEMNVSPNEILQYENITITANLTDKIGEGIKWVRANITKPNGNVTIVNLTNTTSNPPWGNSSWYGVFTNTSLRGMNYSVIVYAEDVAGGYTVTDSKNFTVYVKLVLNVSTLAQNYEQGKTGTFTIKTMDALGVAMPSINVTIKMRDADGNDAWFFPGPASEVTKTTSGIGVGSAAFTISDDASGGLYYWYANATYNDSYDGNTGKLVYANSSGAFFVGSLSVSTGAGDLYSPGETVTMLTTIVMNGAPASVNYVTMEITYNGSTIKRWNATEISGPAYLAEYTLPTNATPGTYVAKAIAYYGPISNYNIDLFTVTSGIRSLVLEMDPGGPYRSGDTMSIKASVKDSNNNHLQGANLTVRIAYPNGTTMKEFNVSNFTSPSYFNESLYDLQLGIDAPQGHYTIYADAKYDLYTATDIKLFDIYRNLFAKIGIQPIIYLSSNFNTTMEMSVMVLDPETGTGIDPDEITLTIYYTENASLSLWRTLQKTNLTNGSDGVFTYSENLSSNTSTGSYLAILEARKGTVRAWGMETFRVSSGIFDITFDSVTSPVASGGTVGFTILLTYFGEATTRDITLDYWIEGTEYTNYRESFANPAPGVPVYLNKTIPNVVLPEGTYTLKASIIYDPASPPATAETQFQVGAGLPPPAPRAPAAAAGAAEEKLPAVEHPLVILDIYPPEVHVERGGSVYLMATVNNTGGITLNNVIASLEGLPSGWYEMIKWQANVLNAGELFSVLIQIKVPLNTSPIAYNTTLKVSSMEASDEKSVIVRVFESKYDLVAFEIAAAKERSRTVERRIFKAISEGKNVSEGLSILDDATAEIWNAEGFLKEGKYSEALGALENAMRLIDKINELVDKAKAPEVPKEVPTETPAPKPAIPTEWFYLIIVVVIAFIALIAIVVYLGKKWSQSFESFAEKTVVRLGPVRRTREPIVGPAPNVVIKREEAKPAAAAAPAPVSDAVAELKGEHERIKKLLTTLQEQRRKDVISQKTYEELKARNEQKLSDIEEKIKRSG